MKAPNYERLLAFGLAVMVSGLLAASAATARTERAIFDVSVRGIGAATVQYVAELADQNYAVTGLMQSNGLVGALVRVSYEATAIGRIRSNGYLPFSFFEKRQAPDEVSTAKMEFRGGVPQVKAYDPPRKSDKNAVDPSTQAGTVDPMTVIFAVLRDQPRDKVCDLSLQVFDGKRRSQVTLKTPSAETGAGEIICKGEYRRIAGWSKRKLAEKTRFPFDLTYQRGDDGIYRVIRVETDTTLGRALLKRR